MARARSPNRDKAKELYLNSCGDIKLKTIAEELNISYNQVRKWKSEDEWDKELKVTFSNGVTKKNRMKNNEEKPFRKTVKELMNNDELTDKQRLFCIFYAQYMNATKAYQLAYKTSYDTARSGGYENLTKPHIRKEIKKLLQDDFELSLLSKEFLIKKMFNIVKADLSDYISFGSEEVEIEDEEHSRNVRRNYVFFKNSNEVDCSILSEVSFGKSGAKVKTHDFFKAVSWLEAHEGWLTPQQKADLELVKSNTELIKTKTKEIKNKEWE